MILKGILDGISDGIKSVLCFTDRAYIKINGKRIKRITTSDIIDNIFQENIGNEIYNKPKIWTKNSKNSEFAVL